MPRLLPDNPPDETLAQDEVFLAAIAYVPVLCLLPTLSKSDSEFARVHGRQGVVLFLAELLAGMAWFIPGIGPFVSLVALAALLGLSCVGAREALARRQWTMPFVGTVADKLKTLAP